jgi:hypothetical protein
VKESAVLNVDNQYDVLDVENVDVDSDNEADVA